MRDKLFFSQGIQHGRDALPVVRKIVQLEPLDIGHLLVPGDLPFGKVPGRLLQFGDGFFLCPLTMEILQHLQEYQLKPLHIPQKVLLPLLIILMQKASFMLKPQK